MSELTNHFSTLPTDYQNLILLAQEKFQIEIVPLQELKGGKTGAYLFLGSVSMLQSGKVQHLILKLDHKNKNSKMDELERHSAAFQQAPPEFARNHIADVAFERIEMDETIAIFYSIAGQSLLKYKSLATYQQQIKLERIFDRTNDLLLKEWNKHTIFEKAVHPQQIISNWLGYRLQPGGNIEQFIEDICNVSKDTAGFIIQGEIFPNPLVYSRQAEMWNKARPIDIIVGFQHGDLNIGNILVKFSENVNEITGYYLIDFALFKTTMPLFYDLSYLEISYLVRELSRVPLPKWIDMVSRFADEDIIDPHRIPIELAGACAVINTGRKTFNNWIQDFHQSLSDDLWGQYWLSAVAAGLNFCNKNSIQEKERFAGLIFASVHLKRYHSAFGVPLPVEVKYLHILDQPDEFEKSGIEVLSHQKLKHNLPSQTTAFIGRQKEVEAVIKLLQRDDVRLVTLTGPGGTGKTRLALQSVRELIDYFKDGISFVNLAPLHEPDSVLASVASSVGIRETSNRPLLEELKIKLQSKKLLLLLDNFEHVLSAAPQVGELLLKCPQLKLLITSRETLHLRGEYIYPVPPLELPQTNYKQQSVEQITKYEAVRLFIDRAVMVKPDFNVSGENASIIAEICLRLDGLPLAIELAAARINVFSTKNLLERIEDRLKLLRGGALDLPARQKTLRDTIDWSYEMLNTAERLLFSAFSVFSGCTLETLERIIEKVHEINKTEFDIIDGISSLIEKSLIRKVDENTGVSRLLMLETIREYAAEKLESFPGLAASIQKAHAEYFADFTQHLKKELTSAARESSLIKACHDIENMKIAWRYWVAEKNIEQLHRMTDSLWLLYDAKGWYYSTLELTTDLIYVLSTRPSAPEHALLEIMLQTSLARVLMSVKGYTSEVEKAYTHALELCQKYGEIPQSYPILRALGGFYAYTANFKKSAQFGKQIINLGDETNNINLKVEGMLLYGYSLVFAGNIKEGLDFLEKVISNYNFDRHGSHSYSISNNAGITAHTTSALCLWMLGFPDKALELADNSLLLANKLKHPYSMAYALFHTGLFHLWRQDFTIVLERANSALKIAEEYEYRIWKAVAVCLHGAALAALGQTATGLSEINQGIDMYTALKTPKVFWPILLTIKAGTYIQTGQPKEALTYVDEALKTIGVDSENPMLAEIYRLKGEVLLMISHENQTTAGLLFQKALAGARKQQTIMFELRTAISLYRLLRTQRKTDQGRHILSEAFDKFTEGFTTVDLIEAQKLLTDV